MCIRDSDGAGAWRDSKSVAFRPEPFGRLAVTDRIDCCDSCMFCFVVCLFYAVSYTHLDVYKRQDVNSLNTILAIAIMFGFCNGKIDVYKRQE